MGDYFRPGNEMFQESLRSEIYVDKSGLIEQTNARLRTMRKFLCVSRPRRFGKSVNMNMLAAYYDSSVDSDPLFRNLAVARSASYRQHLNQYHVIQINIQEFLSQSSSVTEMLDMLQDDLLFELTEAYDGIHFRRKDKLIQVMKDIHSSTGRPFVILIDEWDCLFREYRNDTESQNRYLDFLRAWLKDQRYVALAYMTGILPIKKYGTHSALNMFEEYSMTNPGNLAQFFGFTEQEVRALCSRFHMSFEEAKAWYDGYRLVDETWMNPYMPSSLAEEGAVYGAGGSAGGPFLVQEPEYGMVHSIYSPRSIIESMLNRKYYPYWNQTETYEALKVYICMDYDGLKDSVVRMLAGESAAVDTSSFSNDMTTFHNRDDVLTLLIHLGYLSYNSDDRTVRIPNKEVSQEYVTSIRTMDWPEVARSILASKDLLKALWAMDGDAVTEGVERAHEEISVLTYHDENSLSCTIMLAFYYAREYYTTIRELPTGKGFADIAMIPRTKYADKPAVLIELKRDQSAEGAIAQIHDRHYTGALKEYLPAAGSHAGGVLLCGINYNSRTKTHTCRIEQA